jgi:hypothetical protein
VPSLGPAAAVRPGPPPTPLNEAAVGGDRLASGEAGGGVLESYPNEHGGDVAGEKWKHSTATVAGGHLRVVHHSCCTHVDAPSFENPGTDTGLIFRSESGKLTVQSDLQITADNLTKAHF